MPVLLSKIRTGSWRGVPDVQSWWDKPVPVKNAEIFLINMYQKKIAKAFLERWLYVMLTVNV